jgi:hypothetical protein
MKARMTSALLGAPASRRPVGSRNSKLAGETPALPGTLPWTLIRNTRNQRTSFPLLGERIKGEGGRKHFVTENTEEVDL